ncbi:MAG: hypothetical protein Q8K32_35815 [Archangium sp.]|nr:hypothetical protein [Archangium sp.]
MRALIFSATIILSACQCGTANPDTDGGAGGGDAQGGGTATGGGSALGGGSGGGAAGPCVANATALSISPSNATVAAGASQRFTATATVNGQPVDVTSSVTFTVRRDDDSPAGTIDASGNFIAAAGVGGSVHVEATDGCVSATTDISVTFASNITAGDGGVTGSEFGGTVDTTTEASLPKVVYPHSGTRFPRNIYKVLFQWQRAGHAKFRLTFTGPGSTVQVFTDGRNAICVNTTDGCWEADAAAWLAIAGSNAGGEVQLVVDGVDATGGTVFRGTAITLGFSRRDVKGAIFYWSTTSAGIRRATVSDNAPEPYLVGKPIPSVLSDGSSVQCVACHTVSRSGRKLFAGTKTSIDTGLFVYDVTLAPPPSPVITDQIATANKGFGTFSPDDTRVVATVGDKLVEFDSTSGQRFVELPLLAGTNPDWSPLGHELAYSTKGGDSPGGAALASIARGADGGWGSIRTLVAAGTQTALFPSFAPDGLHVAYARGRGGHGDKTFQLWLVGADGGMNTELLAANRKVNNCLGIACDVQGNTNGQYENSMPTWAPPGDLDWVAFNSQRPYGVVYPTGGTQQIWVAAIDRSKLGQRLPDGGVVDPSYPAFRFSFQDLAENNHRAFWTLDVRVEQDAGVMCVASGQACTANSTCCGTNTCQSPSELVFQCLPPNSVDAGACVRTGASCSQTSGGQCCDSPLVACDVQSDGGAACMSTIN